MSDALTRARKALNSRDLDWIRREVPPQWIDSPEVIRHLLAVAATADPSLQDNARYREATAALGELEQERTLSAQVSGLYHNAKLREMAGPSWDYYWSNPSAAYEKLVALSATDPKAFQRIDGTAVMQAIGAAQEYAKANGIDMAGTPAATPIPSDAAKVDAEYGDLVKKSATERLSTAELQRLNALKGEQLKREPAMPEGATWEERVAHAKALGVPAPPRPPVGERQQLLAKYGKSGLNAQEYGRLTELTGQAMVADGRATAEDIAAEGGGTSGESDNE